MTNDLSQTKKERWRSKEWDIEEVAETDLMDKEASSVVAKTSHQLHISLSFVNCYNSEWHGE